MKKRLCLLVLLVLGLTGCGGTQTEAVTEPKEATTFTRVREGIPWIDGELGRLVGEQEDYTICFAKTPEEAVYSYWGKDLYRVLSELDSGLYKLEEGLFLPLEKHTFCRDYVLNGKAVHVEFQYHLLENDRVIPFLTAEGSVTVHDMEDASRWIIDYPWELEDGRTVNYPLRLNVFTGEVTDFLEPLGHEKVLEALAAKEIYAGKTVNGNFLSEADQYVPGYINAERCFLFFDVPGGEIYDLQLLCGESLADYAILPDWSQILCKTKTGAVIRIPTDTMIPEKVLEGVFLVEAESARLSMGASFALYLDGAGVLRCRDFLLDADYPMGDIGTWRLNSIGRKQAEAVEISYDGRTAYTHRYQDGVHTFFLFDADTRQVLELELEAPEETTYSSWAFYDRLILSSGDGRNTVSVEIKK